MKIANYFLCIIIFSISLCFTGSVCAANKVYPLDTYYGIVADDNDWSCIAYSGGIHLFGSEHAAYKCFFGGAKNLPISFYFFKTPNQYLNKINSDGALGISKVILANYAEKSNTVFSGLEVKSSENNGFVVISGCYFDNNSSGRFSFYIIPLKLKLSFYCHYYMFVKIDDESLDDHAAEPLFQETFNLITPLIIE
jgi:hypothetical protein